MSANYYLDSPDNEAGHIGKWAAGHFTAKAPANISTFAEWKGMLDGHRIFAEHGIEYTPAEMIEHTRPDRASGWASRTPRASRGEWMEEGILFVRHDFC